jgi:hypothetical protein
MREAFCMSDHSKPCQANLDRATRERIGHHLRVIFAEPMHQPLPDRMLSALHAIQDAETAANRLRRTAALDAVMTRRSAAKVAEHA